MRRCCEFLLTMMVTSNLLVLFSAQPPLGVSVWRLGTLPRDGQCNCPTTYILTFIKEIVKKDVDNYKFLIM